MKRFYLIVGILIFFSGFQLGSAWIPYPGNSSVDITHPSPTSYIGDGVIDEKLDVTWDISYEGCNPSHYKIYVSGVFVCNEDWDGESTINHSFRYSDGFYGQVVLYAYAYEWGSGFLISDVYTAVSIGWYGPLGVP